MAQTKADTPNWMAVGPEAKKKLSPLVKHYMAKPHPFTACVHDNTKRFGPERAKKVCAVVKDIGHGGTGWRKGPKKKVSEAEVEAVVRDLVEAGLETVHDVELLEAFLEREDPDLLAARAHRIEEARKSKAAGSPGKCASCGKGLPKAMKAKLSKCPHCGKAINTESDAIEESTSPFELSEIGNPGGTHLAGRARGTGAWSDIHFDPHKHPRGRGGEFAEVLGKLTRSAGLEATASGGKTSRVKLGHPWQKYGGLSGVEVERHVTHYSVKDRTGKKKRFLKKEDAAHHALELHGEHGMKEHEAEWDAVLDGPGRYGPPPPHHPSRRIREAVAERPHQKLTDNQLQSRLLRAKARVAVISGPERGQHQKLADELLAERRQRRTPPRA